MDSYDDILDHLHQSWEQSQSWMGGSRWVINAQDIIETLIDSFVEDDYRDFLDILDLAHDDMKDFPQGQERRTLESLIEALMRYEH